MKVFDLDVSVIKWNILPDVQLMAYAFNRQVPGPRIRLTEGDHVRINVTNLNFQDATLHATVELNGEKQSRDVPVKLEPANGGVRVTFSFPISLDGFKVERPELLLIKVEDKAMIAGDLQFGASK